MNPLYLALPAFLLVLLLRPQLKAFIALFLMMQAFDLVPSIVFGFYVWDYGASLLLLTGLEVYLFRKPVIAAGRHPYLVVLRIFLAWLALCLVWSLVVYRYPWMHTLKNARQVVLGYAMTFIFLRVFTVEPAGFEFFMRWLYRLSFALMPVVILEYFLKHQVLFGLFRDYEGDLRAVPTFLPICLFFTYVILAKFLSAQRLAFHERVYAVLAVITVALSFTRGIYAGALLTAGLLLLMMARQKTLRAASVLAGAAAASILVAVIFAAGIGQKVLDRASSGLQLIGSSSQGSQHVRDDTYTGRLGLAAERFSLVMGQNPVLGFGFIHEDDVPPGVRSHLHYGTALSGTAEDPTFYERSYAFTGNYVLGFYSADIAWADILISTGIVGVVLVVGLMVSFLGEGFASARSVHPSGYAVKTGLFLTLANLMLLTVNSSYFYSSVHVIAFLLAGYALTRRVAAGRSPVAAVAAPPAVSFANLLRD